MSNYNMDNIGRSLEEDLLLDLVESPINLFVEGVDSAIDVDAINHRLSSVFNKLRALSALIYLKESTILSERKEDALKGSIYFNKETNNIEYFDGQAWRSNIFGSSVILDTNSYTLTDLTADNKSKMPISTDIHGIPYVSLLNLKMNMGISENQIIFIIVDGDIIDKSFFTIDKNDNKNILFSVPITVYNNITYYVLGAETSSSGSIPRYEVVSYQADGSSKQYPISNNPDFVVTYKSSLIVTVDGKVARENEYKLNTAKNAVSFVVPPKAGADIEIRTLYGVVTDFRTSITYVEQIVKAEIDKQKVFKYNGVCDALKVYLNGIRLISGNDFDFNYALKTVVLKDRLAANIKAGDTVIIEKELVPMSKEPMPGVLITETYDYVPVNTFSQQSVRDKAPLGKVETKYFCNGVANILAIRDNTTITLTAEDYFISDNENINTENGIRVRNVINIVRPGLDGHKIQVTYLTNAKVEVMDITKINDNSVTSTTDTFSCKRITELLNSKANTNGSTSANFKAANIDANGDVKALGMLTIGNDASIGGNITSSSLEIKRGDSVFLKTSFPDTGEGDISSATLMVNGNIISTGLVRAQELVVENFTNQTITNSNVENNTITLNSNKADSDEPFDGTSGIVVKRGKAGSASILFSENGGKWLVGSSASGTKGEEYREISLAGHTHTIEDLKSSGIANFHTVNSYKNTQDSFYKDTSYQQDIEAVINKDKVDPQYKGKAVKRSISRLNVLPSALGASLDTSAEISESSVMIFQTYSGYNENGEGSATTFKKEEPFAIIEDGSIISNSTGAFRLPSGTGDERWSNNRNYCGIKGKEFSTNLEALGTTALLKSNGLIRYSKNNEPDDNGLDGGHLEVKIDGSWVIFKKPDSSKKDDISFDRGRYVQGFGAEDFVALSGAEASKDFGLREGDKVLKIQHNLNCLYVRVDIFDDKRTSFPLLYKCIDENNVYVVFPSNIVELSSSNDIRDWLKYLSDPLHTINDTEGKGHQGRVDTSKNIPTEKKFVAFVTAL